MRVIFYRLIFDHCTKQGTTCKKPLKSADGESTIEQSQAAVVGAKSILIRSLHRRESAEDLYAACRMALLLTAPKYYVVIRFILNNRMGGADTIPHYLNATFRYAFMCLRGLVVMVLERFIPWGMYRAHRKKRSRTHHYQSA